MKETPIAACYVTPSLSKEEYMPHHTFTYLVSGYMTVYDSTQVYRLKPGDYGLGRRNHLAKYTKEPDKGAFKKIFIIFEQEFLKTFSKTYQMDSDGKKPDTPQAVLRLKKDPLIKNFVMSLMPYFNEQGIIDEAFLDLKRSELLLILLKQNPELKRVFFDFSTPDKIDLEKFMIQNYRFNVSIERFAYLTGRSLSAFKRDFQKIFEVTPSHWLVQKRLEEAHYLMKEKNKKPSEIYLDLGFEDLSHFSFAFKKVFGLSPNQLKRKKSSEEDNTRV